MLKDIGVHRLLEQIGSAQTTTFIV